MPGKQNLLHTLGAATLTTILLSGAGASASFAAVPPPAGGAAPDFFEGLAPGQNIRNFDITANDTSTVGITRSTVVLLTPDGERVHELHAEGVGRFVLNFDAAGDFTGMDFIQDPTVTRDRLDLRYQWTHNGTDDEGNIIPFINQGWIIVSFDPDAPPVVEVPEETEPPAEEAPEPEPTPVVPEPVEPPAEEAPEPEPTPVVPEPVEPPAEETPEPEPTPVPEPEPTPVVPEPVEPPAEETPEPEETEPPVVEVPEETEPTPVVPEETIVPEDTTSVPSDATVPATPPASTLTPAPAPVRETVAEPKPLVREELATTAAKGADMPATGLVTAFVIMMAGMASVIIVRGRKRLKG